MVVDVSGSDVSTATDGRRSATATSIGVRSEIEGPVSAINAAAGTLTVLGQLVQITPTTVFDDDLRGGLAAVAVGMVVEVYGFLQPSGQYLATRIDDEDDPVTHYKLRAVVSGLDPSARTFRLVTALVSHADISASVSGLANGQYARVELQLALLRDPGVAAGSRIRRDMHLAVLLGLFGRIAGKVPGHGIVRRSLLAHQIERDHGKLRRAAALQKQDLMCVRHRQCGAKTRLHILKDIRKGLTSVTHLHHGHAGALIIEHFRGGGGQHLLGEHCRTGREIVHASHAEPPWVDEWMQRARDSRVGAERGAQTRSAPV